MESADTISPANIELEEKENDGLAVNRDKKRTVRAETYLTRSTCSSYSSFSDLKVRYGKMIT